MQEGCIPLVLELGACCVGGVLVVADNSDIGDVKIMEETGMPRCRDYQERLSETISVFLHEPES